MLTYSTGQCLIGLGDSRSQAFGSTTNFIVTACACLAGFTLWDLRGFMLGFALGTATADVLHIHLLGRHGIRIGRQDVQLTLAGLASFAAAWALYQAAVRLAGTDTPWMQLVCGMVAWVALFAWTWPVLREEVAPRMRLFGWLPRWRARDGSA